MIRPAYFWQFRSVMPEQLDREDMTQAKCVANLNPAENAAFVILIRAVLESVEAIQIEETEES